jgi:hypothetical protein
MTKISTLYKYRSCRKEHFSILKKKRFYFSDPSHFNDPYDCQIDIKEAVQQAIEHAETNKKISIKDKIRKLIKLNDFFQKIEKDVKSCGVLSFAKRNENVLMWSHYADQHKGYCLGFNLSERFTEYNSEHFIIGKSDIKYFEDNPFIEFFLEFSETNESIPWDDFWIPLLALGMASKSEPWDYEEEVRVLRIKPGVVQFEPNELVEIVFGLRICKRDEKKLRTILRSDEWKHVKYKRVIRKNRGFKLEVVEA